MPVLPQDLYKLYTWHTHTHNLDIIHSFVLLWCLMVFYDIINDKVVAFQNTLVYLIFRFVYTKKESVLNDQHISQLNPLNNYSIQTIVRIFTEGIWGIWHSFFIHFLLTKFFQSSPTSKTIILFPSIIGRLKHKECHNNLVNCFFFYRVICFL